MPGGKYTIRRPDLLYPELSFIINGVLIDVSKQLGGGHHEKYYQKATRIGLQKIPLQFREQVYVPLRYQGEIIVRYFLDFLIEEKNILELKRGQFIPATVIQQTKQYLMTLNLQLAIIACFTYRGVIIKRIINQY